MVGGSETMKILHSSTSSPKQTCFIVHLKQQKRVSGDFVADYTLRNFQECVWRFSEMLLTFALFLFEQIEVDLGKKCWYHSIFACPILRQQTTDNNPPMKLVCGHIISRDALNKMFNGSK